MNWRKWRWGLVVALLSGVFTGLIGLGISVTAKQLLILIALNIGKDGLLYIKSNPIDQVSFDTSRMIRDDVTGTVTTQSSKTVIIKSQPDELVNQQPEDKK